MLVSSNDTTIDSFSVAPPRETGVASGKTVEVLCELLRAERKQDYLHSSLGPMGAHPA